MEGGGVDCSVIRVLILADSAQRAQSLAEICSDDSEVEVVHAGTARMHAEREPLFTDVVIYAGLDSNAIETIATPTVVLAKEDEEPHWPPLVRAWMPLHADPSELLAAIHAASQNLTALTQVQASRWLPAQSSTRRASATMLQEQLTRRELQVLRMLADGLGNKEIATTLRISEHTAKSHVGQILAKLGAVSRAEAAALGIKSGLVPL